MRPIQPPLVKNIIRRSLREIIDPSPNPKQIRDLWSFFESRCAYCEASLPFGMKEAHIDHLVSSAAGASNHISNRVLACAPCNEKEKLDSCWDEFLRRKTKEKPEQYLQRRNRILEWQKLNASEAFVDPDLFDRVRMISDHVIEVFESAVKEVRQYRSRDK